MSERKVIVTIDALGRPKIEADGFAGASCEVATKPIEEALAGGNPLQREYKPEWEQSQSETVSEEIHW